MNKEQEMIETLRFIQAVFNADYEINEVATKRIREEVLRRIHSALEEV